MFSYLLYQPWSQKASASGTQFLKSILQEKSFFGECISNIPTPCSWCSSLNYLLVLIILSCHCSAPIGIRIPVKKSWPLMSLIILLQSSVMIFDLLQQEFWSVICSSVGMQSGTLGTGAVVTSSCHCGRNLSAVAFLSPYQVSSWGGCPIFPVWVVPLVSCERWSIVMISSGSFSTSRSQLIHHRQRTLLFSMFCLGTVFSILLFSFKWKYSGVNW